MFFKLLREALKVKQVRSKIFILQFFIVLVFRIGTSITVPGVNALSGLSFLNMLSLVSGNAMKTSQFLLLVLAPTLRPLSLSNSCKWIFYPNL